MIKASSAAAIAPSSTKAGFSRTSPEMMGVPSPPAPTTAPTVAVPTLITTEVRIPAMITLREIGSSILKRTCARVIPMPVAASMRVGGTDSIPAMLFRMIGSML